MDENLIIKKFGENYSANKDTYHMGIDKLLAEPIAKRFSGHNICLDACAGAGFMAIILAKYVNKIILVDTNPMHLEQARTNLSMSENVSKANFILGDIIWALDAISNIDSAFLDPDWAEVGDSKENHVSELSQMVPPADILLEKIQKKTRNICLRLPKEFDTTKLDGLPPHESESVYLDNKLKFKCVYFGDLVKTIGNTKLRV